MPLRNLPEGTAKITFWTALKGFTQLERLDFSGKKVMAVMTHEGSGLGSSERDLKRICKGASFGDGLAIRGADAAKSESKVVSWAEKSI